MKQWIVYIIILLSAMMTAYAGDDTDIRLAVLAEDVSPESRALAIWEKAYRSNHPDIAMVLRNMARLYGRTGDKAKETEYKDRAAKIQAGPKQ